jgi:MerR family transcriptional regulator/heat shock protein HspR
MTDKGRPLYMIGVVAEMLQLHPQTLRMYEKKGLIRPSRTEGRTRMYSSEDVEEIARVIRLARDLGVNLAGIEIVLRSRSSRTMCGARWAGHRIPRAGAAARRWCGRPRAT